MRVLIVGCGYIGLPLGAELSRQGHAVVGLSRGHSRDDELRAAGINPIHGDVSRAEDVRAIAGPFDWIVNCVSTRGGSISDYRRVYLQGMRNLLERLADAPLERFVYTSSTSVYGQKDGSQVDEQSPTEPDSETGRILLETERLLVEAARDRGFPGVILRLSGIYGPGRGYWLQKAMREEWPAEIESGRIINQIHRDDVIGCVQAAIQRGRPGSIYNATDDEPVRLAELLEWLAGELGRSTPRKNFSRGGSAASGEGGGKHVSNRKLKQELGYQFVHPSFREGYGAELNRRRS